MVTVEDDALAGTRFIDGGIMRPADDGGLELVGGACASCGLVSFPAAVSCARCGGGDIAERALARRGTLWTWTTQGFPPKSPYTGPSTPETFEPYAVGYVELPDGIRVEARLLGDVAEGFEIGQPMELTTTEHATDDDGTIVEVFAFRAVEEVAA